MRNMSVHFCDFVNKSGQKTSNKGDKSPALMKASHPTKAGHPKGDRTFAGMPPPPMFVGLATMPVASTSSKAKQMQNAWCCGRDFVHNLVAVCRV